MGYCYGLVIGMGLLAILWVFFGPKNHDLDAIFDMIEDLKPSGISEMEWGLMCDPTYPLNVNREILEAEKMAATLPEFVDYPN